MWALESESWLLFESENSDCFESWLLVRSHLLLLWLWLLLAADEFDSDRYRVGSSATFLPAGRLTVTDWTEIDLRESLPDLRETFSLLEWTLDWG